MKTFLSAFMFFVLNFNLFAQTGSTCADADVISSIPYQATGLTTIGTSYNTLPCSGTGPANFMSGKDYVFSFTPQATTNYTIRLQNTSVMVGLFVTDLCPDDPLVQCIANNKSQLGNPSVSVNLNAGQNYYIIVSSVGLITNQTNFDIYIDTCMAAPTSSFSYVQNGLTVEFTNSSTNATHYAWYFGDELLPPPYSPGDTTTNPVHTYSQYGTYEVMLISYNNCGQTDTLLDTITLECPYGMPHGAFTYGYINGREVSFINHSVNATSYVWYFGDELLPPPFSQGDTTTNPIHVYNQYGSYLVTLVAINECGTDTVRDSLHLICNGPMPSASFTYTQNGATVQFTNTSTDATSYQWYFGDEIVPFIPSDTTANPTHTYLINGTYVVTLVATNECGNDTTTQTIVINSVYVDSNSKDYINYYPNPIENYLVVEAPEKLYIYIYDIAGKIIIEKVMYSTTAIDLTSLPMGYYTMVIKTDKMIQQVPLIKE